MLGNSFRVALRTGNISRCYQATKGHPSIRFYQNPSARMLQNNAIVIKLLPNTFPRDNLRCGILFSGILTFLGLKKQEVEEESELILTIKKGILSIQLGDMIKAEKILHHALKLAHEESNEDGITYVYDLLGNIALDTGQDQKAEKLFINVMQRLISSGYETTDVKVLHISLKLARIYENTNNYEKSETGYKYCMKNMEDKVRVISEDAENYQDTMKLWITTLDNYARFLVKRNRIQEALDHFQEAHKASVLVNGRESEETVLLLNDLGTVSSLIGDLDSAVAYVEEAVEIAKDITDIENISIIYMNLGYLYLEKEMYSEAKYACQRSLRYARRDEENECIEKAKECLKNIDLALKNRAK